MYQLSDDPWAMRERWYEQRKRALLLACLPRRRYRSVFEPGCATGETSAALAERCDALLCSDTAAPAVALSRQRLHGLAHVQVIQSRQPEQWPEGTFDLIVLNEIGYYLDSEALDRVTVLALQSLSEEGQLLACHWRQPITGCEFTGDQIHGRLQARMGLTELLNHQEADFVMTLWSRDPRSVAAHEGLS
nr:SAM-dependent methyltransferase [Pseudomonas sp. dw_358]